MERYQVILAYDGAHFLGFQRQAKGRTVQGAFEAALRQIGWQGNTILAAGRTDSGVHAQGQVVAFDLEWQHSPDELLRALNSSLPPDVAVQAVKAAAADFHPRFHARARRYRYRILCQPARDPLRERYAWRVWPALSLEALQAAARQLPGEHDFAAFGAPPRPGESTTRSVFDASWQASGDELSFAICGNAFLYHMVRRLVFVQVMIGKGWLEVETIGRCLQNPALGPQLVRGLAPAQGLTLVEVSYPTSGEDNG